MSELKQGDKVTHKEPHWPLVYTVKADPRPGYGTAIVTDDGGRLFTFSLSNLTKVVEPEAKLKAGDRVRAERSGPTGTSPRGDWVEGVLLEVGLELPNELVLKKDDGHRVFVYADTAEKVEGFPAGTVAVSQFAPSFPALRRAEGWTPEDIWSHLSDAEVRGNPYFTIVHEPAPF